MNSRLLTRVTFLMSVLPLLVWPALLWLVGQDLPAALTNTSVALLIAHPDDEAMFFGPVLHRIAHPESNNNVTIVCFSSGDFEGLGDTRKQELVASARIFGVPGPNVRVVDDRERFPDSQSVVWDEKLLAAEISALLTPETIILTFDQDGVSGHANHKAVYGASVLEKARTGRPVYVLKSLPTVRKYLFVYDAIVSYVAKYLNPKDTTLLVLSSQKEFTASQDSMINAHVSQMRWFRYGWIGLSRYMYSNDVVEL